jgi:hypothetical protein
MTKIIPEQKIESCEMCPYRFKPEYECGCAVNYQRGSDGINRDCPLEDYIEPVQPFPDCGGSKKYYTAYAAVDCPTCKRTTSCTGNPESCKSKEPQVENPYKFSASSPYRKICIDCDCAWREGYEAGKESK